MNAPDLTPDMAPCARCGHEPACGYAYIDSTRYCHDDFHSCYVLAAAENPACDWIQEPPQVSATTVAAPISTSPVVADTAPPTHKHYVSYGSGCLVFTGSTEAEAKAKAARYCCSDSQALVNRGGV